MNRNEFDYQREAQAAMRIAADARGFERLEWVRLALAWRDLGRHKEAAGTFDTDLPPSVTSSTQFSSHREI
jgi:hypothetical protein